MKTIIDYPNHDEEIEIMKNNTISTKTKLKKILTKKDISEIKKEILDIHVSDNIYTYVKDLIFYTRENKEISHLLAY